MRKLRALIRNAVRFEARFYFVPPLWTPWSRRAN